MALECPLALARVPVPDLDGGVDRGRREYGVQRVERNRIYLVAMAHEGVFRRRRRDPFFIDAFRAVRRDGAGIRELLVRLREARLEVHHLEPPRAHLAWKIGVRRDRAYLSLHPDDARPLLYQQAARRGRGIWRKVSLALKVRQQAWIGHIAVVGHTTSGASALSSLYVFVKPALYR